MISIFIFKVVVAAYPLLEYWLGKTTKVKSNSLLELILQFVLKRIQK